MTELIVLTMTARAGEERASNAGCFLAPDEAAHPFLGILCLAATADWIALTNLSFDERRTVLVDTQNGSRLRCVRVLDASTDPLRHLAFRLPPT